METIKGILFYGAFLFLSAFALTGCVKEPLSDRNRIKDNDVTVVIKIPGATTRAITEGGTDDNAVTRADILLFNLNDAGRYAGRVSTNTITTVTANTKSFTVRIPEGNFELVILANAMNIVNAVDASLTVGTTTKSQVYGLLTESLPARTPWTALSGVWNAQPGSSGYKPFPMWGEVTVDTESSTTVSATLLRMLAKINLTFLDQSISDKLELEEIILCNYNFQGYLASPTWAQWTPSTPGVANPFTSSNQTGFANGLLYANTASYSNIIGVNVAGVQVCKDEIFLFEVAAPANPLIPAQRTASLCLIVKGRYAGDTESSYYRINMVNNGNFLNILRNHNYDVVIQDVRGPGANTGEIAYDSETVNITAIVRQWNAGYEVDVDYSGQFQLIVSQSEFDFDGTGAPAQELEVFSNHPAGWTIEFESGVDWIHISPDTSTDITDFVNVSITCDPNTTGAPRTGKFYITTPLIRKEITVNQEDIEPYVPGDNLLYFDGDVLLIGRWGIEVNSTNLAFFNFGSTVGFLNGAAWDASQVRFNTAAAIASFPTYNGIPQYDNWNSSIADSPETSDPSYHFGYNVLDGRGDPCQLVGLSAAAIRGMTGAQVDEHFSGWRMPSAEENALFVGGPNADTWEPGGGTYSYINSTYGYWTDDTNPYTPVPSTGLTWGGGWFPVLTPASPIVNIADGTFLPAAGMRNTSGSPVGQGISGQYWSSTPASATNAYHIYFSDYNVYPVVQEPQNSGYAVRCVPNEIALPPPAVEWAINPWVGTFHRYNETGERIIYSGHTGTWTATVIDGAGWIRLDGGDANIAFRLNNMMVKGNPGNPEANQVTGSATTVSGTGNILFRVGLTGTLPTADTEPRYARIQLTWSGGTSIIYVRQGEEADYVMGPDDAVTSADLTGPTRPDAVKFSPFNLTAPSGSWSAVTGVQLGNDYNAGTRGVFTEYPSQAGAYFQWSSAVNTRFAYNPFTVTVSPWSMAVQSPVIWNEGSAPNRISDNNETCPPGYRRPNDGPTSTLSTNTVTGSEIRQSLFASPAAGDNVDALDNSIWGYYADGFFDRRPITGANAGAVNPNPANPYTVNSTVSVTTEGTAYVGRLYYNPANYASIFLPAAGLRDGYASNGILDSPGIGHYWLSSSFGTNVSQYLYSGVSNANVTYGNRSDGFSVRCVKDEPTVGEGADLLYFDGDVLKVGKWADEVNSNNLAFFQFGSTIGFVGWGGGWSGGAVAFNTTSANLSFSTYGNIPNYNAWNGSIVNSPTTSSAAYHHGMNVLDGRGDPCKLAGLSATDIRGMTAAQINALTPSGWRTPTAQENAIYSAGSSYVGGWQPGGPPITSIFDGFWTSASDSRTPVPSAGTTWGGGWFPVLTPNVSNPTINTADGTFLPAAGYRNASGSETGTGDEGVYWSNTPSRSNQGYNMWFYDTGAPELWPTVSYLYSFGLPIRCIRPPVMAFPLSVELGNLVQMPAIETLSVITQDADGNPAPSQSWTLTSSASWLTLSTHPMGLGAGPTVSGTGAQTVYLVVTQNTAFEERRAAIYLGTDAMNVVSTVVQLPAGGSNDLLYFAADGTLQVGKWGPEVNSTNVAYFKFGGVVGVVDASSWSTSNIRFNPSTISPPNYASIPSFTTTDWNNGVRNISTRSGSPNAYHTTANVLAGKGDPCRLVGYTGAQIRTLAQGGSLPSGRWRMATARENVLFVGGANPAVPTWQPGNPLITYNQSTGSATNQMNYWVNSASAPPVTQGVQYGGGWLPGIQGAVPNTANGSFFPATGTILDGGSGTAFSKGTFGDYFSSTPFNSSSVYSMEIWSVTAISNQNTIGFGNATVIRCVLDD
ncbi:MAG: hypothetical protein FWE10_03530 [Rikenellaceae bacterium]|nr:hypothetical protein [Rikenellaceae bacterium]MCL2693042.1 hypothetical protein [Rikenellaceae bacterium]